MLARLRYSQPACCSYFPTQEGLIDFYLDDTVAHLKYFTEYSWKDELWNAVALNIVTKEELFRRFGDEDETPLQVTVETLPYSAYRA